MRIDIDKLETALARCCMNAKDLNGAASLTTVQRIRCGYDIKPKTAGKIAKILNVDISELVKEAPKNDGIVDNP